MAVTAVFDVPGMTKEQYEQVIGDLSREGAGVLEGRRCHIASAKPGGWYVVDVWDSPEAFQEFGEHLMPILIKNGVTPPQPLLLETHTLQS